MDRRWASGGYLNQRETEFREEQGAFPNEIWERGGTWGKGEKRRLRPGFCGLL